MHDILPTPGDEQRIYSVKVKGMGFKPNTWRGFVVVDDEDDAEAIIHDGTPGLGLSVQGVKYVKVTGAIAAANLKGRIMSALHPNAVVFRDDSGKPHRVHRGMLREEE